MSRYIDIMNVAIEDNQQQLITSFEAVTKDMTEEEKSDFYDFYENDMIEAGSDFPAFVFSNFVISWYSFIEHQLIRLCKSLNLKISVSIQDNTRYEEGIRRARKFLKEAANYEFDNTHWQELVMIGKIRNKLVHEDGALIPMPTAEGPNTQVNLDEDHILYLPIDGAFYRYLCEYNLYRLGQLRFTPDYLYCKHLVSFGTELLRKIYKDFSLSN